MTDTIDLPCGCQVEVAFNWADDRIETEITYKCDPHWQKKRIYEVANLPLEEDPNSVINFVEWWRKAWASWQTFNKLITALEDAIAFADRVYGTNLKLAHNDTSTWREAISLAKEIRGD